jgi:competence protein ComEC
VRAAPRPDPDPDGVALAAVTAAGVLLGSHLAAPPALVVALAAAAVLALATARPSAGAGGGWPRRVRDPGRGSLAGVLVLGTLGLAGAAAASLRADAVRGGVLLARAGRPGVVQVDGTVAAEPRPLPSQARWVVLSVDHVAAGGRAWRTRERAGVALPGATGRLGVGDRLRLRAGVGRARSSDPLGHRPPVTLRHPQVQAWAPAASAPLRASEAVRAAARDRALASLPPERAGLLLGMALGDTSLLPRHLEAAFRAAGLTHLMAVSGANLAVVLGAGLWLAAAAGAARPVLAAVGVGLVALLVLLTRWEPSVLRAGVMAVLVLLGVVTGRGPGGRRALCLAVLVLLLADPGLAGALGFQLSVAATAGVLWVGPLATRAVPRWVPDRARSAAGITLGAQVVALPALALALGRFSPASLPANLAGLPLAGGPMLLGMVAAVAAPPAPALSTLACRLADPFLVGLIAVARWAAGLPGASLTLSGPLRAVPAAAALAVVLAAAALRSPAGGGPGRPGPRPPRRRGGSPDPATPGRSGPRAPP